MVQTVMVDLKHLKVIMGINMVDKTAKKVNPIKMESPAREDIISYDERRGNSEGRGNNQREEGYNNERCNNNSWNQEDKIAKIQKQGGCFRCGGPHLKRDCPQNNFNEQRN